MQRVRVLFLVISAVSLAITSCGSGGPVEALGSPKGEADSLGSTPVPESIDEDTIRHLADFEGISYFVAEPLSNNGTSACLVAERSAEPAQYACGSIVATQPGVKLETDTFSAILLPDAYELDASWGGWERIASNLAVQTEGAQ